jgi:RNA-directed DNA polymerase
MLTFANVVWGARCGESARRVLLGETRSRGYAYSVRRRRESALTRQAPHGLPSSRLVSTILIDEWFTQQVQPRLRGPSTLARFCDDFVMLFAHKEDAERVLAVLGKRLGRFGLQLHPDKTRLVDFRPVGGSADGKDKTLPTTFAFLGFAHVWGTSRKGNTVVRQFTAKDRLARSLKTFNQQCRRMMHWPLKVQHDRLCRMNMLRPPSS